MSLNSKITKLSLINIPIGRYQWVVMWEFKVEIKSSYLPAVGFYIDSKEFKKKHRAVAFHKKLLEIQMGLDNC